MQHGDGVQLSLTFSVLPSFESMKLNSFTLVILPRPALHFQRVLGVLVDGRRNVLASVIYYRKEHICPPPSKKGLSSTLLNNQRDGPNLLPCRPDLATKAHRAALN